MKRRFAVIGLGSFGAAVARTLAAKGASVLATDTSPERVNDIKDDVDEAVVADARDREALEALVADRFDAAVVSLGESIEATTLAALHLKELGVEKIVVKACSADHAKILEMVGATDVVLPEYDTAVRLARSLVSPNVIEYFSLAPGYSLAEVVTPRPWVGKRLADLDLRRAFRVQVVLVKETVPERVNPVPGPADVLKESDVLVLSGSDEDLERVGRLGETEE